MKPITSEDEFEVAASDYREAMTGYRLAKSQAQADVFAVLAAELATGIHGYCRCQPRSVHRLSVFPRAASE